MIDSAKILIDTLGKHTLNIHLANGETYWTLWLGIATLAVLAITLIPIWCTMSAQLVRDRWDTFLSAWEDTSDELVRSFKAKPYLYVENMDKSTLNKYKEEVDGDAIKDYLLIVNLYEYLAFAHELNTRWFFKIRPGHYGDQWVKRWIKILSEDCDFPHVHKSYKNDHPKFHEFVERELKKYQQAVPRFEQKEDPVQTNSQKR